MKKEQAVGKELFFSLLVLVIVMILFSQFAFLPLLKKFFVEDVYNSYAHLCLKDF